MSLCSCDPEKEFNFDCFSHGSSETRRKELLDLRKECDQVIRERDRLRDAFNEKVTFIERENERLVKELDILKAEVKVARERLGPAGHRIIQEVARLRTALEFYAEPRGCCECGQNGDQGRRAHEALNPSV